MIDPALPACCLICTRPLPPATGRGRPRAYCSPACRRTAEFEIRRLHARLGQLEVRASELRLEAAAPTWTNDWQKHQARRQAAAVEDEIARLTARLRERCAAEGGDVA